MASRSFYRTQALDREIKALHLNVTFNSSGVVTSTTGKGASVAKTATGVYTVTLEDRYASLQGAHIQMLSSGAVASFTPKLTSHDVNASTPVVTFTTFEADTATDPTVAGEFFISLFLKNTSD